MPGPVFLQDDRVELRTVEEADLPFLQEGVNHPEVRPYLDSFRPYNDEREHEWYERVTADDSVLTLLVCDDGDPVGVVALQDIRQKAGRATTGAWIHPDHQREGYAAAAMELLVEYAFDELRLHKLCGYVFAFNEASRQATEAYGFEEEGYLREHDYVDGEYVDVHCYGLLEEEWEAMREE